VTPPRDPCALHNLWFAHAPTFSQDGTRVYVICACDRPRAVTPAQWQAELARRAQAARQQTAAAGHNSG
jgi:hypothetical protein